MDKKTLKQILQLMQVRDDYKRIASTPEDLIELTLQNFNGDKK